MPTDPPDSPSRPRRLRGAPLHNLNALKHGFYSRKFRQADLDDLAESKFKGLDEEITMLRVFMRRVIERSTDAANLNENILILKVLALAATSLTRMAKTQKYLQTSGSGWSTLEELSALIKETNEKLTKEGVKR
jgi:hypothetical protein